MKNTNLFLILICLLGIFSCKENVKQNSNSGDSTTKVEVISENDRDSLFIDISLKDVATGISKTRSSVSDDLMKLCRIANYRFYSHVKIVDGYYVCNLKNGAEINVSETLFSEMSEAMRKLNSQIKEQRSKNNDVVLPEITDEYLNSLLKY